MGPFTVTVTQGSTIRGKTYFNYTPVAGDLGTSGSFNLKWEILDVLYAPPGNKNQSGMLLSAVTYGTSFASGTTVSNSQSFMETTEYSITGGALGEGSAASLSFSQEQGTSDSEEIKATNSSGLKLFGSMSVDGIDHDGDMIVVMLNPSVGASIFAPSTAEPNGLVVTKGISSNTTDPNEDGQADILYFSVGVLKQLAMGVAPSSIPALAGDLTRLMRSWTLRRER
jgi:hypothetical protein